MRTAEYFVGFQAVSTQITVEEKGPPVNYQVQPTVPFPCLFLLMQLDNPDNIKCLTKIEIVIPTIDWEPTKCADSEISNDIIFETATTMLDGINVPQDCTVTVEFFPFRDGFSITPINISIAARQDGLYDGDHEYALQMRTPNNTIKPLTNLWSLLELPRVQVC